MYLDLARLQNTYAFILEVKQGTTPFKLV